MTSTMYITCNDLCKDGFMDYGRQKAVSIGKMYNIHGA